MRILSLVSLVSALAVPASGYAGGVQLPHDLSWCQARADVEFELIAPREVSDGVVESQDQLFDISGFTTAIFEGDQLYELRFRCFYNDGYEAAILGSLSKQYGAPAVKGRARSWSLDGGQSVTMKVESEQMIHVAWVVPSERCGADVPKQTGPTEAEIRDRESVRKKQVVSFDPYADEPEDVEKAHEQKKKAEDKKKTEAKKKDDKPVDDGDIDW